MEISKTLLKMKKLLKRKYGIEIKDIAQLDEER